MRTSAQWTTRWFATRWSARSLATLIVAALLFTALTQPIVLAARPVGPGMLAGQSLAWPDASLGQQSGAPQDPLQAALAGLPQGQTGANPQAPWPNDPPKPPDFQDTVRASVDASSGTLGLSGSEFEAPFYDLPFGFSLAYSSAAAGTAGTAGYGWSTSADQYLRMYVDFNISEFRGDGSHVGYLFKPTDPNQFVDSYDGDTHIYYNLDQGHYETQAATNTSTLTRLSATDYLVRRQDGTEMHYAGYTAPWHTPRSKTAGRLTKITNPHGNSLTFTYNSDGLLTDVADSVGRKIELSYEHGLLTSVTDPAGGVYRYAYVDGLGSVTDLTDGTGNEAMQYRYDAFGGIFTGITSPYNTVGFTGKTYDPKAGLVQFYSRRYDPSTRHRSPRMAAHWAFGASAGASIGVLLVFLPGKSALCYTV